MANSGDEQGTNDIAIVGLALRVPGATSSEQFWANLRNGTSSIETRTVAQLTAAGESPERIRRKNYVPRSAVLPGMADFDAEFFGFSPKDAAIMDPQHRQFLECAWEAIEDAGRPPESIAGPVGVFAGCGMGSYFYFNVCTHARLVDQVGMFLLRHTGNDKDFLATRASYLFDLRGPSVNVQTACSTSLVAIHYACQSLLSGECDMALAGGVTIELPHGHGYLHQDGEILAPDGHCRAFDHRSAGTVFGSGVGVVTLRRLADAVADGDPIRAVIKATAINNDGAGKASYLAPSVTGQAETVVEAHVLAGIDADTIQYVECHGTGTNLGDPIEIAALTEAFRQSTDKSGFCRIGSVKTNIGHLDTAAGVVSLIKTVLSMEHGEIPASLGYEKPNPAINFASSPFIVNDRLTPWPRSNGPRRAGVNSLGVGGTNAHAIIEEAPPRQAVEKQAGAGPHLIAISARSRKALDQAVIQLGAHLRAHPELALDDVACTLVKGRKRFEHRRVFAVADREDAIAVLVGPDQRRGFTHTLVEGSTGAVLMFPGGGAQYPAMGRELYRHEPVFARIVDAGLGYLPPEVSARIRRLWLGSDAGDGAAATELLQPSLQLPAILIIEVALARLWQSWGLKPSALIGHSMGEYAAACVAEVMGLETAVRLVLLRGELFDEITGGGMLSVQMPAERLLSRLPSDLDLAVVNAPELAVVSGPIASIEAFQKTLADEGLQATRIPINVAAHSRMLEPILGRFECFLRAERLATPRIPLISNLTGTWLLPEQATDPLYWVKHLRSTVRFADGLSELAKDKSRIYIEAGPGRALSSLCKAQGRIEANAVINSLPHSDEQADDRLYFMAAVGRAWSTGLELPIDRMWGSTARRRVRLPTYPFQHQHYFLDRVAASGAAAAPDMPCKRPEIATWGWRPAWKPAYADTTVEACRTPGTFLVFVDNAGVGAELTLRLRAEGHRVATVSFGDSFAKVDDDAYVVCPEHGRDGYDSLIRHLTESGGIPSNIVHFWLLTVDQSFRPGSSFFHRNQERGFWSLFFLAQALANASEIPGTQITVLTNGMQRVSGETVPHPEKATVLGPLQVIPREMPGVHTRAIDVALNVHGQGARARLPEFTVLADWLADRGKSALAKSIVDLVWDDLFARHGDEVVAYRNGRRLVQVHEEVRLDNMAAGMARFRENGAYLITGGLGDLATVCAIDLANRFKARIALLGRLELPPRSLWPRYRAAKGFAGRIGCAIATIEAIESAGGEVLYVRGDVTNTESMRRVVSEVKARFGRLNGVLHAAGVVNDGLIQLKSPADVEDVLAPKVLGTMVLDAALADEALDLFVLFSSTSSDTAPAGQVDYVAANAYLNAFADSRAGSGRTQTVAVHWGVWSEVGLAARATRSDDAEVAPRSVEPADQPLLDTKSLSEGEAGGEEFELQGSPARDWLLDEHRLASGEAVWPGTGYLELVAEGARECGLSGAMEIRDLTFLRPLHVADGDTGTIRVRLRDDHGRMAFTVESRVATENGPGWLRHATAVVQPVGASVVRKSLDVPALVTSCSTSTVASPGAALRSAQEDHLKFGPRWKVLKEIHLGRSMAIARLRLDAAFHADLDRGLLLHPALMDIATGFAMQLIAGYDPADGLWVPASYGAVRLYAPLPAEIWSRAEVKAAESLGEGFACFDVTITDPSGTIVCEVEGLMLKQFGKDTDFSAALHSTAGATADAATRQKAQRDPSPAMMRLAAQVDQGIAPQEGFEALLAGLGTGLSQVVVSSIDLPALKAESARVETRILPSAEGNRMQSSSTSAPPTTEVEKTLAGFWSELLGIERPGVNENFFDLGGHSLVAVRLFRMIKKAYAIDLPISVLFEAPTIAACARIIEQSRPPDAGASPGAPSASPADKIETRYTHLVQMHAGKRRHATPLFICAGMFGNILNLRHLAVQIGQDRPVYGLQARGLYGDQLPHETFEEMARDYLAEVRQVQPHGPYLFAGFSGGGIVAYEMAQQLVVAGETVAKVVLLDTPYPNEVKLSVGDRVTMKLEDLRRDKAGFVVQWLRKKILWELQRRAGAEEDPKPEQFHNNAVEAAFRRAVSRYRGRDYGGPVLLLRPRLQIAYSLRDERKLNADRCLLKPDNGWQPFVEQLTVMEVPGDHDSMVLEPNVRVLAGHVRDKLKAADRPARVLVAAAE